VGQLFTLSGMNANLARLISDYQSSVRRTVELMVQSGIALPATNNDWVGSGIPQRGELTGGVRYFKHGFGCAVRLPNAVVDFDFGERGEIDGFDASRLVVFAGSKLLEYGFASEAALNACFDAEVAAGSLVYSGRILYCVAANSASPDIS
jgi:hypothetical protein